jgi:uncharacterized repeat protein (TIGR01451 family)
MLSSLAPAGTNSWTAIGPSGGQVNKIAFNSNSSSIVYALSAGGFQRSTDGGVSWQLTQGGFENPPTDLAVDPSNPSRIYVVAPGAGSGLSFFLSTDAGVTLNPVQVFPAGVSNGSHVQVSQDGRTVCATGDMRVFCSTDTGQTWTERTALGNTSWSVFKLLMDPGNADTLYASVTFDGTTSTLLVSHDGAGSWQQLTSTPSGSFIVDLAISAANPAQIWAARTDGLWMSADSGATWTGVADPALGAQGTSTVVIDPTNPAILYVGTGGNGTVASSSDLGAHWTNVSGNLSVAAVTAIAVDPSKNSHLLVGGQAGLSGTVTSGSSWSPQTAGLIATQILGMTADPVADRIYLTTYTGDAYYFAAGGGTPTAINGVTAQSIYALPGLSGDLLAGTYSSLSNSTNGGNTWTLVQTPTTQGGDYLRTFASSPGAPQTVLATSRLDSALFRSVDAGSSWTSVTAGLPSAPIPISIAASSSDPMTMYMGVGTAASGGNAAQYLGVYRSTDAGQTWNPANSGISTTTIGALAVDPTNSQVVYATTDSTLIKTTDGGSSWSSTAWPATSGAGAPFALAIDPAHPQVLYAAGSAAIGRSVDGGTTWESLRTAQSFPAWAPTSSSLLLDPNRPSNVLVGTLQSGVQVITIAPDLALQVNASPSLIGVGLSVQYTYTITNNGPFHATGVQAVLSTPAGTQNPSATTSAGTCATAGMVVTCGIGILHTGASATITLSATPAKSGTFQINGTVQADEPDSDPTNNSVTTTQTAAPVADLSVTAAGPASAHVGDQLTYTLTVQNTGPSTATAAQLTYQLASGLAVGTVTSSSGTCSTSASALITCSLGDIAVSKSVTVTVGASASQAGTQVSMATVTTTSYDPTAANDSGSNSTMVSSVSNAGGAGGGGALSAEWLLALVALLARKLYRRNANVRL